jgi:ATP-dependent DNA helicase RecG
MIPREIKKLMAAAESRTVEFKAAFLNEAVETIAAFSNAIGGTVILGVSDKGQASGLAAPEFKARLSGKIWRLL